MLKKISWLTFLFVVAAPLFSAEGLPKDAVPLPQAVFNFDRDALGKIPSRFSPTVTGKGDEIHWEVRQDPHAPSLPNIVVQSGKAEPGDNFALLLLDNVMLDHAEIAVRFRPLAGEENQSAGILCRYKDPQNYYVIQADSKADTCSLVRIKNGKKKVIDTKDVVITTLTWHELRVTFSQNSYTALIDGELVLGAKDSGLIGPGLTGLWTMSDSSIAFDDLRVAQ